MRGWVTGKGADAKPSRSRSAVAVDSVLGRALHRGDRQTADVGNISAERSAKLCGDQQEHAYEVQRISVQGTSLLHCSFTTDKHTVACSTASNTIMVVNTATGTRLGHLNKGSRRLRHCFTPNLSHSAVYGDPVAPAIELHCSALSKFVFLGGHTAEVRCCVLSENGNLALSGGRLGQLFLWRLNYTLSGEVEVQPQQLHESSSSSSATIKRVCLLSSAGLAASADSGGCIAFWELDAAPVTASQKFTVQAFTTPVSCLAIAPDGRYAVAGSHSAQAAFICLETQQATALPAKHAEGVKIRACAVSPDSSKFVTASSAGRAVLWSASTLQPLLVIHEHTRAIRGCCFSSDGAVVATCGEDGVIALCSVVLLCNCSGVLTPFRLPLAAGDMVVGSSSPSGTTSTTTAAVPAVPATAAAAAASGATDTILKRMASIGASAARSAPMVALPCGSAAAAMAAAAPPAGSGDCAGSCLHPLLTRVQMGDGERLLGCCLVPSSATCPPKGRPTPPVSLLDATLCVEQGGRLLAIEAGSSTAVSPGHTGVTSISCCSYDQEVVASVSRDGSISVCSCIGAADSLADAAPGDRPPPITASAELVVFDVALSLQQGRVLLAGVEKKQSQCGVLSVFEFDTSEFGVTVAATGLEALEHLVNRDFSAGAGLPDSRINSSIGPADLLSQQAGSPKGRPGQMNLLRDNPARVMSCPEVPLLCCAWGSGSTQGRAVVGSAAGWLSVVEVEELHLEVQPSRYNMHSCEVTAVDLSGTDLVVSGGVDGKVVVWSATSGFKMAVFTLHRSVIRSVCFDDACQLLAVGDGQGVVSSWNLQTGALLGAAKAHSGSCTEVCWGSTGHTLVSVGSDGYLSQLLLQPDDLQTYDAAFRNLYHSSSKKNKVQRLQTALLWHLQHGLLQGSAILQSLLSQAAVDGNATVMSLVLPLFVQHGWLVHLGPVFRPPIRVHGGPSKGPLMGPHPFSQPQPSSLGRSSVTGRPLTTGGMLTTSAAGGPAAGEGGLAESPQLMRRSYKWVTSISDMRSMLSNAVTTDPAGQQGPGAGRGGRQAPSDGGMSTAQPSLMNSPRSTAEHPTSPRWSPIHTPQRLLSPSPSNKRRAGDPPVINLHTLHEERGSMHESGDTAAAAAAAARLESGATGNCSTTTAEPAEAFPAAAAAGPGPEELHTRTEAVLLCRSVTPDMQGSSSGNSSTLNLAAAAAAAGGPSSPRSQQQLSAVPYYLQASQIRGSSSSQNTDAPLSLTSSSSWQQSREAGSSSGSFRHSESMPNLAHGVGGSSERELCSQQRPAQSLLHMDSSKQQQQLEAGADQSRRSTRYVLFSPRSTTENLNQVPSRLTATEGGAPSAADAGDGATTDSSPQRGAGPGFGWQASIRRAMLQFGSSSRRSIGSKRQLGDNSSAASDWASGLDSMPSAVSSPSQERIRSIAPLVLAVSAFRRSSKQQPDSMAVVSVPPARSQKQPNRKDDILQQAMASQQAQAVRVVVDALVEGIFSQASITCHLYEALQALIHSQQHHRITRRLLKHMPLIDNGELEVESLLTETVQYKCSRTGHPGDIWCSAGSGEQLLGALDVLIKRASWQDSIVALLLMPIILGMRYAWKLWLLAIRSPGKRGNRVLVSANSKLLPMVGAAEIRKGSRTLLRQLISTNLEADLYGQEVVRAVIQVKWESFARAFLLMQWLQYMVFLVLFVAYLGVSIYHNDASWTTAEMIRQPAGQAAVALESILMIMMFGQAADEVKQMVTYKRDYFNSPWNYMDVGSCLILAVLFLLHITRYSNQVYCILMALEFLLLCLRMLYFCMALDQIGALLRMVMMVIKDMRYFFVLLAGLLCTFGLTFSVLMSAGANTSVNVLNMGMGGAVVQQVQTSVFGTFQDSILQLFTVMFGDVQYTSFKSILDINTVASRLAVTLACGYAVLVLIVLVNLLIAIVDQTYEKVKETEVDQILRNKALIIDEIESTLTDACIKELNSRVLLPYVHVLVPQQASSSTTRARDVAAKLRKLKQYIKRQLGPMDGPVALGPAAAAAASAGGAAAAGTGKGMTPASSQRQDLTGHLHQIQHSVHTLEDRVVGVSGQLVEVRQLAGKVAELQTDMAQIKELLAVLVSRGQ